MKSLAIVFALLIGAPAEAADQWPDAFSRRDFKLGTSLSAFRKAPYPDAAKHDGAFAVCSDEQQSESYPFHHLTTIDPILKANGGVVCRFYAPSPFDRNFIDPAGVGLDLADEGLFTDFFFMPPSSGEEPVLFKVETAIPARMVADFLPILQKGYGDYSHRVVELKTRDGRGVENDIYSWSRGRSTVELHHFYTSLDGGMLIHSLDPVAATLRGLTEADQAEKAKKL